MPKFAVKCLLLVAMETWTAQRDVLCEIDTDYDRPHFLKVSRVLADYFECYRPQSHAHGFFVMGIISAGNFQAMPRDKWVRTGRNEQLICGILVPNNNWMLKLSLYFIAFVIRCYPTEHDVQKIWLFVEIHFSGAKIPIFYECAVGHNFSKWPVTPTFLNTNMMRVMSSTISENIRKKSVWEIVLIFYFLEKSQFFTAHGLTFFSTIGLIFCLTLLSVIFCCIYCIK